MLVAASLPLSGLFFVIQLCVIHCQASWERPPLFHFAGGSTVNLYCLGRSAGAPTFCQMKAF